MEDLKTSIKQSLTTLNKDREWFAGQVGVSKRTVDNWLSSQVDIPQNKIPVIKRVLAEEAARQNAQPVAQTVTQLFSVEVDLPTYRRYSRAALKENKILEDWVIDELNKAAAEYRLGEGSEKDLAMVADPPAPYEDQEKQKQKLA